ncbi:A disintegrin and metalloproteinase with thrombospondin motifs 16 [Synchiropus splendidus]|uniref:A disintegrin and metalloproteinase with thrombospondin motifs 16 n=1 Tax=Synchiropus splendidus TaxID=270530 RepID=UPI00237DBE25|nr:A disintegrin and metalloproteinase with thrombospondin motifs 16 [Synchiropus splendidus]
MDYSPRSPRSCLVLALHLCWCLPLCQSAGADSAGSALLASLNLPQHTEYEIVSPYEVSHRGTYISHQVAQHQRRRRRRSVSGDALVSGETAHFRVSGLGQDFHMELSENSKSLIAPGFTVQVLGNNGTKGLRAYQPDDLCFYQGSLRSRVNSSVALATCYGLTGLIRTQDADYFLRPVSRSLAHTDNFTAPSHHQPHILYKSSRPARHPARVLRKRSADPKDRRSVTETAPSSQPDSSDRNHHNGRLEKRRRGRKQRQHFCGRRKKYMPKPPEEDVFILPDEFKSMARNKRAALSTHQSDQKLNVETLVVVDRKMMDNHGRENITTYVLTVLNMVSSLFKDGTIGGSINIVIVGLVLLDEEQEGLVINHHADHTLNSFCHWQSTLGGREGQRHDHAILLTGLDICSWKNEPCDTLGFAPISGMCSKYRSCTVNEDTGLGLAFTIAHESGHNFGMVHDGEGNVCKKSEGNIMSPTLAGHDGIFSWSSCSRQYLSRFLNSAQALCLSDEPRGVTEYQYPEKLPGELYDADTQCKWQFGEKAKLCTLDFKKDVCKALWCHRAGRKCETKFMPAAEGSACGPEMTVVVKKMEEYYGVVTIPAGARSIRVLEMNTSNSYLAVRDTHRRYHLNGQWTVDWPGRHVIAGAVFDYKRPYNRPESLTTAGPTNDTLVVELLLQGPNPGVHWAYTMKKADESKGQIQHNYTWAIVRAKCSATCAGGQMNTKSACYKDMRVQVNTSYCNPRSRPATGPMPCNTQPCPASWSTGSWGECSRSCGGGEQTRQVQCVQRIAQTSTDSLPDSRCVLPTPARRRTCNTHGCPALWTPGPWSQCSRKCGNGLRKRTVLCTRSLPGSPTHTLLDSFCSGLPKPSGQESCFIKRCEKQRKLQWFVSTWQECSVTCGRGRQARFIKCAEKDTAGKYRELAPKKCHHISKPIVELQRTCDLAECPVRTTPPVQRWSTHHRLHSPPPRPEWRSSAWSQCSVTCGGGVQGRDVHCLLRGAPVSGCALHLKPSASQACNTNFCPQPEKKDLACKDFFTWCYLVPQHGVCNHKFYGKECCQSCSNSNL